MKGKAETMFLTELHFLVDQFCAPNYLITFCDDGCTAPSPLPLSRRMCCDMLSVVLNRTLHEAVSELLFLGLLLLPIILAWMNDTRLLFTSYMSTVR